MIERPSPRSTSAPSTFIATSQTPVPMPNANRPTAQTGTRPNGPAPTRRHQQTQAQPQMRPDRTTAPALHRWMSAPADGSARIDPTAIASSSSPRAPLSSDEPAAQVRDPGDQARRRGSR